MHAYLIVGDGESEFAKKLKAKRFDFELRKIEDARKINAFTSLTLTEPTAICIINSIEEATVEALNAFLKNLEEPQENLFYILKTSSIKKVLPTIVSRCQIVRTKEKAREKKYDIEKFLKMTQGEKLEYLDPIKEREKALEFIDEFIRACHAKLHSKDNYIEASRYLEPALSTLKALKANGNVTLQLTNFTVNLA